MSHIIGSLDVQIRWTVGHKVTTSTARAQFETLSATHDIFAADGRQLFAFDPSLGVMYASPRVPPPEVVALWPTR